MTNGNDGGWGSPGSGGSDWDDWNSVPDPETSEFDRVAWSDTEAGPPGPGSAGWYGADSPPGGSHWGQPTEATPRKKWWPVAVGVAVGVVILLVAGVVGVLLADRGGGPATVEAVATTVPSTSGWSTAAAPTPTEQQNQVVPAQGRSSGSACTASDISRDLGEGPQRLIECFGDYALVSVTKRYRDGGVVQRVNGTWSSISYTPAYCVEPRIRGNVLPAAMVDQYFEICTSTRSTTKSSRSSTTSKRATTRPTPNQERRAAPDRPAPEAPAPPPPPPPPPVDPEPVPSLSPTPSSEPTTEASVTPSANAAANRNSEEG